MDDRPLTIAEKIRRLRREMAPVQPFYTYHDCWCGMRRCRSIQCWRRWQAEISRTIGVIHATWLVRKIREGLAIEADIQHFVKSQTEGGK